MSRAVGVEVREASVRLAWVDAGGKRPRLLAFHETPFPAEPGKPWEARASEALRAAFTASGAPRGRVVACLDSGDAILREVSLPFKTDEQIRKTVRFEMESLIHNYTIEQLVVAHYRTGETEKGATLLAAAVPKEAVAKRLKVFQDAGLDPVMLDLDVCAVFNAMNRAGAVDTDEAHLLIYGTTRFTKLVLIEGRQPRSIRTIRFSLPEDRPKAGPPLPSTGPEAIVLLDAEEAKRFGELDQGRQGSLIEILAREISRFLLANAASASPSHILLAGDFEDEDAARMLEAATEIPVRTFPLLEAVDHALPKGEAGAGAKLAAPLGLALKAAGVDALGMDFRQEEFLYRKKFEAVKTTAWVTVELVLVFLAAVALHAWFQRRDLREDAAKVLDHQRLLYENIVPGETLSDPLLAYTKMEALAKKFGSGGADAPVKHSAREVWRTLAGALGEFYRKYGQQTLGDGPIHFEVETFEVQQSATAQDALTVTIRGKIKNLEFAGALKNELRATELFRNADYVGGINNDPQSGYYTFTLRATKARQG
jgi:Tfp pilus assembly PilM family ATPase